MVQPNENKPNATRVEDIDVSKAPGWMPDIAKDLYKTETVKSAVAGLYLVPDYSEGSFHKQLNSFSEKFKKIFTDGSLEQAFKKFGDIEFVRPLDTQYIEMLEMTKGKPEDVAKGTQRIYQAAVNYVNSELSVQEKAILSKVIKSYRLADGRDSVEAIDQQEGESLAKLTKAFLNNDIRGGKEFSAKQLGQLAKETNIDLNLLQEAASSRVK